MPYLGDLRRMNALRLLEILGGARKSGMLRLRSGREGLDIYLRAGRCEAVVPAKTGATADGPLAGLGLPAKEQESLRRMTGGDELGAVLLLDFFAVCGRERSRALLREQASAALRAAADWQKGDFRFEPTVSPPEGRLPLGLPVGRLRLAKEPPLPRR